MKGMGKMADEDIWRSREMCPYDAMGDYSYFFKKDSTESKSATVKDLQENEKEYTGR